MRGRTFRGNDDFCVRANGPDLANHAQVVGAYEDGVGYGRYNDLRVVDTGVMKGVHVAYVAVDRFYAMAMETAVDFRVKVDHHQLVPQTSGCSTSRSMISRTSELAVR
jgi:hypothetical protein